MVRFVEYVAASDLYPSVKDSIDEGLKPGLVRGYQVEVQYLDGKVAWDSCCYIQGTPEQYFNDDFHEFYYQDRGVTPTGRICFRGYGIEDYDILEHDTFVLPCDSTGKLI